MGSNLFPLLGLVSAAAFIAFLGGLLPAWRKPDDRIRSYLLHLAAGVLLAVVTVEIWPEIDGVDYPVWTIAGLAVGALFMIVLNAVTERIEARKADGSALPVGLIVATATDSVIDGMLIGVGYASDPSIGILLAVGLGFEKFTTTMTVCAEMRERDRSRRIVALGALAIAGAMIPSAALGYILLSGAPERLQAAILAVAASALIYLVTVELMTRGRNTHATPSTIICFFIGFVGLTAYEMFAEG